MEDKQSFDHALEYAKQVKDGCPFRAHFESAIELKRLYSKQELIEIIDNAATYLFGEFKFKLDKMNTDKDRLPAFRQLFEVNFDFIFPIRIFVDFI